MNNLNNLDELDARQLSVLIAEAENEARRRATERALRGGVQAARDQCETLAGFVRAAWPILEPMTVYRHGRLIEELCAHLEAVTYGKCNRLLINVPPGCMKSLLVSVLWPAWEWGAAGKIGMRYLSTSASEDNMRRDCRKMRDLVLSDWYQALWPEVHLIRRAETDFANEKGGGREGRAFANLTGGRADRLLIDDPHTTETAESEADRATAIRIFRESVPLRINDPANSAIVIIMQRLHQHDVSGVALALKLGYVHLMLPMEFEADRKCVTPFGGDWRSVEGELLFEARFSKDTVARDKVPLGSYGVAGQFQQRPSARGGIMFKRHWFKIIPAAPAGISYVRGWDLAATEKKTKSAALGPAYTAGVKLGRTNQKRFVIAHVTRLREEGAAVRTAIYNTATADGHGVIVDLPQDPGQAGKTQAQDMIAMLVGFTAFASPETGDKITRAQPVAAQAEAGNVDVVEGPWNEDFFAEAELFPTGAYKDQIDALSRAFARFVKTGNVAMGWPTLITEARTHFGDHPGYG
jgi:predicted phage terminase large subunit-like protein